MPELNAQVVRTYQRRQHLAFPGDEVNQVFLVESGWLARYTRLPSGERQITGIYLPGDFCEPQWIIDPVPAEWVVALSPVQVRAIPLDQVSVNGATDPALSRRILADLIKLVGRQSSLVASVGRKSGLERLSSVVIELYDRLILAGMPAGSITMPLIQGDLADIVGITPIHVNRILKELRAHGVLEVTRGAVSVLNPELLRFVADNGHFGAVRNRQPKL